MLDFNILFPSVLNGITTGAVYALIALGLTLIYGVLQLQKKIRRTGTIER